MKILTKTNFLIVMLVLLSSSAYAAKKTKPSGDIIIPDIERSDTDVPRIKTEDFEVGAFAGIYSTEDFGTNSVYGITGSYHFTEDIFYNVTIGSGTVTDASSRASVVSDKLTYLNLLFGYNVLPGEVYSSAGKAWSSSTYFVAGLGVTELNNTQNLTVILGGGLRLVPSKSIAVHIDFRDYILNSNLIGRNKSIQNIEITAGATWFF
ncbi:hypothetical protein MNBD_GAMMA22-1040 [hydrothermal vent metagenome]|uniref:Outer membrane protein beta-barrel domain-containing protein n=1 Tax=hydrothermal vent metagenome TaxID=652676 RepID=A0A3B0ZT28_9ZZZZ